MSQPIDPRRLDIARDLLSRRAEGWSEERIEERRRMLLGRIEPEWVACDDYSNCKLPHKQSDTEPFTMLHDAHAVPTRPSSPQGILNGETEHHPTPLGGNTPGVRRHTKPLPGAE